MLKFWSKLLRESFNCPPSQLVAEEGYWITLCPSVHPSGTNTLKTFGPNVTISHRGLFVRKNPHHVPQMINGRPLNQLREREHLKVCLHIFKRLDWCRNQRLKLNITRYDSCHYCLFTEASIANGDVC